MIEADSISLPRVLWPVIWKTMSLINHSQTCHQTHHVVHALHLTPYMQCMHSTLHLRCSACTPPYMWCTHSTLHAQQVVDTNLLNFFTPILSLLKWRSQLTVQNLSACRAAPRIDARKAPTTTIQAPAVTLSSSWASSSKNKSNRDKLCWFDQN
jgi:hypothetical protein